MQWLPDQPRFSLIPPKFFAADCEKRLGDVFLRQNVQWNESAAENKSLL
jgi:hypothetical protein